MKTILFHVNSLLTGGIEKVLIELLKGLNPQKYHVKLSIGYYMGEQELLRNDIPSYVEVIYLLEHPLLTTPHKNKKTGKTNVVEKALSELLLPPIQKKVRRQKLKCILKEVDVVIDFDTTLASMHRLFSDKISIAYCHFGFDNIWKDNQRKLDKLAYRLSHYTHIVMLCDEMLKDAAQRYPMLSPKLARIYNALDIPHLQAKANETLHLSDDFIRNGYILSVGRLQEAQKDFTTLLKAYAEAVHKYRIKERLIIVGKGGDQSNLQQLAMSLGIENRVLFAGHQSNPYKWMKPARLFLFSSKYEGLPTVLIEAHAIGLPIVATASPTGVKELLLQGNAGTLVPIGVVSIMADAIVELLRNEPLRKEYLREAASLLPQFNIDYMVPELEKLLG